MAPVIRELDRRRDAFEQIVVATAQHRQMLDQMLATFGIEADVDLDLMQPDQRLGKLAARGLEQLSDLFDELSPDAVLVQGDTTSVLSASLASFYLGIVVGHVEAGLRSHQRRSPFPEELNRRIAGLAAELHFAPTPQARANLLSEGVDDENIFVTGNTIVDAVGMISLDGPFADKRLEAIDFAGSRVLAVTAHRRESHGTALASICRALRTIVRRHDEVEVVFPVHPHPRVVSVVREELANISRIHLLEPLPYVELLRLLSRSYLVLTDSGGIQEEAPCLQKPVLVLRDVTERNELIEAGLGRLVGTSPERIVAEVTHLLEEPASYRAMCEGKSNPFGDGKAAVRIADLLEARI